MNYITDTDFLPDVRDISFDVYQLLYGVVVNCNESKIYDSVISLCRKYREPLIRRAKITSWQLAAQSVIDRLETFDRGEVQVFIPYLNLHCTTTRLRNLYWFEKNVLHEVYGISMEDLIRRNKATADEVSSYYPIPTLQELMRGFVNRCISKGEWGGADIEPIIENELAQRGLVEHDSSNFEGISYKEYFFKGNNLPKITYEKDEPLSQKNKDEEYVKKIGFLYYALKHYFKIIKPQASKDFVNKKLSDAAVRIGNGLYKPEEFFDASYKSSDTFYQYVYKKQFNKGDTYEYISKLLKDFNLGEIDEPKKERAVKK